MKFVNANAALYIPDGAALETAMQRTNGGSVGIGAHPDDEEIANMHGIGLALGREDKRFTGIIVTDGGGSARKGRYEQLSDAQMMGVRHEEQKAAAKMGNYSAQFQLYYPSKDIKGKNPPKGKELQQELYEILLMAKPETVYVHNPFDKHPTHNAVTRATLRALRMLPEGDRPRQVHGCEVWRGLDWLPDTKKVVLDVSSYLDLQRALIECHDSQIEGSKSYADATLGRQFANATYLDSHSSDRASAVTYAVDLTPFLQNPELSLESFTREYVDAFANELITRAREYEL